MNIDLSYKAITLDDRLPQLTEELINLINQTKCPSYSMSILSQYMMDRCKEFEQNKKEIKEDNLEKETERCFK
jgi:hypothetical protein